MAAEFKAAGNKALQAKNFDEAIAQYTKAIELDSTDKTFFSNRSAAYLSKGDGENALKDGERCIAIDAAWPKGYVRQGAALHKLRRYDDAEAAYRAGLASAPEDAGLLNGLADVEKAAKASAASNPLGGLLGPDLIPKLAGHPKLSKYLSDPAFMQKLQMLQANPSLMGSMFGDPQMQEVLSFALGINVMSPDQMGEEMGGGAAPPPAPAPAPAAPEPEPEPEEDLSQLTPEELKAREQRLAAVAKKEEGNAHYKAKRFAEALASYDAAIALDPKNMAFLLNKAAVYLEMKEIETCVATCKDAVAVGRENRAPFAEIAKAFVRAGNAYKKGGDLQAAIEEYKNANLENYDKAVERNIKNLELEARKRAKAAYVDPAKAVEAKERGNELFRAGEFVKAIDEYEEAIKRDPQNPAYPNNLAATLSKIGDFAGAKRACEKALDLDDKYVKAWAKKGDIEFLMKEYHKALESYKKGLAIDGDSQLCKQGLQKTSQAINASSAGGGGMSEDEQRQRAERGMADPEIQGILQDPVVRQVLQDLSGGDAMAGQRAMADPNMRMKIEKLIAAGVLQTK